MFVKRSDIPYMIFASSLMAASAVATPLQTVMYGNIFSKLSDYFLGDIATLGEFISQVRLLCGAIMIIGAGKMVFTFLGVFFWMKFGEKQQTRARNALYAQVFDRKVEWFDTKANLMGEVSQVNRCVEELRSGTSEIIGLLIQTIASIIALLITSFYHSWSLTLVIMASTPIMAVVGWFFGKLTYMNQEVENEITAKASKILDWTLVYGTVVRLFNGKYVEIVKFNKLVDNSAKAFFKVSNAIAANGALLRSLSLLMFVQGFWFGNSMIRLGKLEINQVFTCFSSCLMLGASISDLGGILATLNKAHAAAGKIDKFLDTKDNVDKSPQLYPQRCYGDIQFQNVVFQYASRPENVLKGTSFKLMPNELNFIIGQSGSGKSTVTHLLMKLYSPTSGRIKVDGFDISTVSQKWLSNNITLVLQNSVIFKQSLKDNIALAVYNRFDSLHDVPDLLIDDACKFSLLDEVIDGLDDGLNTKINQSTLSGGQQQRLAIARAKIRDTPILILDEAFSALDNKNRDLLFSRIKKWRRGKTTIIITHELSQIEPTDYTVLMEDGIVKQQGPFYTMENFVYNEEKVDPIVATISEKAIKRANRESVYDYKLNPVILKDLEKQQTTKDDKEKKEEDEVMGVLAILKYCKNTMDRKDLIVIGLIFSVLAGGAGPVFSYCFSQLLNNMMNTAIGVEHVNSALIKWSCIVIGVAIATGIVHYLSQYILSIAGEKWIISLRKLCFTRINEQDMSYFNNNEKTKPAEITALLMNDTRDLRALVTEFISVAINLIVMLLVGIIWSTVIGWKLSLVGLSFVPLILIITRVYGMFLQSSEHKYKSSIAKLENHNHETVSCIKSIISLNLYTYFKEEYEIRIFEVNSISVIRAAHTAFGLALSELCNAIATGVILYYGMVLVGNLEYTRDQLLEVVTVLTLTMTNAAGLLNQIPEIARGQRAGTFIIKLLELQPSQVEIGGEIKPVRLREPVISFKNVNFSYGSGVNVLKNISFEIHKNETVSILGGSGSGKSTVTSLLTRLYGGYNGDIFVSNFDLKKLDIDWLREAISVVPQFPRFFEGTIRENLLYGLNPQMQVSDDDIYESFKISNMYSLVVSLPEGLNTKIGEGMNALMSGGQLQRLAIARALVRNPKILILDECTSNLDPENKKMIAELIQEKLMGKYTILLISHDVDMMKFSRLVVLQQGRIVEQGHYDELYSKRGELYKITNGIN
ncbi:P-loop containing nucleoside triphosphate hydrolase protein [Scheffersomyces coipomensis]|uniref:P-loop containing nucleoside triphosphate hydrolase protein n=1 Tax=Scheffersomyces coipomensis TaxID=1788519 RepID=UPI00315D1218